MPEYHNYRCCMCPNANTNAHSPTCPGIPGSLHPDPTPCRFVVSYVDARGWRYKVMPGIGGEEFKAQYRKPDGGRWQGVGVLPWRASFDEAQGDLNDYAKRKKMEETND